MFNQHDLIEMVPNEFAQTAFPGDRLAAYLARRGVRMDRYARIDLRYTFFNWTDPVVGGPQPAQVALRRAISLGYNSDDDLRILRRNQALPAHGLVPPGAAGHDPALRSDMNEYSPARARALLDLYGYTDRDGDGFRERTGWVAADDGLLAVDINGNGKIDDISELFGSPTASGSCVTRAETPSNPARP